MSELISILIPVYNCREWVAQAIESALQQSWSEKEVIVLDDGSTDGSMEAIAAYRGRVRIESAPNGGQNTSRNRLTALSQGEWLVYLDADDELAPDSVEQKMRFSGVADAIYGSYDFATFRGAERLDSHRVPAEDYPDPVVAAFKWKFPNTSSLLFRRSAVEIAGGWNEEIRNCTDYDLYFRLLARGHRFKAAPEAMSLYRQWSVAQAVNESPFRRATTQLNVMRAAAQELQRVGQMSPTREQAFLDASLVVIRSIYQMDRERAFQEHDWIKMNYPDYRPQAGPLAAPYIYAYAALGFTGAEWLAAGMRLFRRPAKADWRKTGWEGLNS